MPLEVPAGTAPDSADDGSGAYLHHFDNLARQTQGYANERVHPAIASDRLASSARQFTIAIDSLGRQLDELKKAGVGSSGRDSFMEAVKALQGELAQGRTSASKTADAHKAIGSMHDRLTKGWDRMDGGQKALVDGISRQLAAMEAIADRAAPRTGLSRGGRIARAVAEKHGLGDHFDAAFAPKAARSGDDYQSSFARLARVAAGRRGLGGVFDAAFKAHPQAAPVRRVGDAVAARASADRAARERDVSFIGPRAPNTSTSVPTVPSAPAGQSPGQPGAENVLAFIKPTTRNTNVASSTQAIPVISIGKDESRIASSMDGLSKNVIRLNDALDRDHRQRLADYEKRRQDQFDHDQALYEKKDSAISHGPGGALAAAASAHGEGGRDHGGGWLSDLVHSVVEGGLGAEAGAAGVGGLLLGGKKVLGRGARGVAKGIGGLGRFVRGRHGKWGLAAGLLAGTAYGAYRFLGADSAQAAENPQGAPGSEDESRGGRRRGRPEDGPEPEAGDKPEMGFNAGETARGAAYHGLEKSTDAVAEHFASRHEAIEHARQHAALDHAKHAPGKSAADFAAKERALLGESPAAHAAKVVVPSPAAPVSAHGVEAAAVAHAEAPVTPVGRASPGASFDKQIEQAAGDVVKTRTGARVVTSAAKAAGKLLSKALGPLGIILEGYSAYEQLSDLYGAHRLKQISDDEFNTEFYAILARMLAGPAGAAIGAKLGALGGGAAGAAFAGIGAGPGALVGGLAGGVAGYFEGPQFADKLVHKLLDKTKDEVDAEIDAKLAGKTTPSEPVGKEGTKPGGGSVSDIDPATGTDVRAAMGGSSGETSPVGAGGGIGGMSPFAGNGATAPGGGSGAAWDGATSHTIGGVGHQGEVHDAGNAFRGAGGRRAGRGVSAAEGIGTADTGGTARPGGAASSVYGGGRVTPSDQTGSGGGSDIDWSAAILRKKEGFTGRAAWDVNHYRLGYGTDTITDAQGNVHEVRAGDRVTREDAERDLRRRMPQFQAKLRGQVGAEAWDRLDPATKGALTSVGYNYGSFGKLKSLTAAVRSGDKAQIANAVRGLQGHNGGVNRQRRLEEASIIESGHLPGSWRMQDPGSTVPGQQPTPGNDNQRPATTPSSPAGAGGTPLSGGSPPAGGSGDVQPGAPGPSVPQARSGETTDQLAHRIQNLNPRMRSAECVGLARQAAGIKEGVRDWRAGGKVSDGTMPVGTPIATFMDRHGNQSDRYDGGQGVGVHARDVIAASHGRLQAGTTHAAVLAGYERDRNGRVTGIKVAQQWVGRGAHIATIKVGDRRGGEADADNYRSVNGRDGQPLGDMNPLNPNAKNYAGGPVAAQPAAVAAPGATPQGAPAAPGAPKGADAPQVPDASRTVRSASPTDKVSTGWDPGMRSSYDAPSAPQVPGAKADPAMRSAYDPAPATPADPGLKSAYDPPPATKVDQPTDVPVQAAKTSAAISAASAPASSSGDSSGAGDSSGGGSSGGSGGGSGGGFCRCTGGGSGGGGSKMDGFGDGPMSPLLAMMNSTLFNRG